MKTFTYEHFKSNFAEIFEMVKNGEEIIVRKNKGKDKLAVILPYGKHKPAKQRPLGILKGKATFEIKNGFKITDQEFLDS